MRRILSFLLILEGLSTALRSATRLSVIVVYPATTIAFFAARLAVAIQQFAAGWMASRRHPFGPRLAQWALGESAVLTTFEIGFGFASTNMFPAYRWWAVGLYWIYAIVGIVIFRRERRR